MESLLLFRRALSSPTMCRFIPALSVPEKGPVEECGAIQSFPPGFCFAGSRNQRYRQLGNAVPVRLAQAIVEHLKLHMASREEHVERRVA